MTPMRSDAAWQARNPIHPLAIDLGLHLDEDFVETVPLETEYLGMMLKEPSLTAPALGRAPQGSHFMVLILEDAFDAVPDELPSTDRLAYPGGLRQFPGRGRAVVISSVA